MPRAERRLRNILVVVTVAALSGWAVSPVPEARADSRVVAAPSIDGLAYEAAKVSVPEGAAKVVYLAASTEALAITQAATNASATDGLVLVTDPTNSVDILGSRLDDWSVSKVTSVLLDDIERATFAFAVQSGNPFLSYAPPIDAYAYFAIRAGGSAVAGYHDNFPSHEIYFTTEGWGSGFLSTFNRESNLLCLTSVPWCVTDFVATI